MTQSLSDSSGIFIPKWANNSMPMVDALKEIIKEEYEFDGQETGRGLNADFSEDDYKMLYNFVNRYNEFIYELRKIVRYVKDRNRLKDTSHKMQDGQVFAFIKKYSKDDIYREIGGTDEFSEKVNKFYEDYKKIRHVLCHFKVFNIKGFECFLGLAHNSRDNKDVVPDFEEGDEVFCVIDKKAFEYFNSSYDEIRKDLDEIMGRIKEMNKRAGLNHPTPHPH